MQRREAMIAMGVGAMAVGQGLFAADTQPAKSDSQEFVGFENGEFVLPPLPYAYDALKPHISEQVLKLHHDKHHLNYVKGSNKAVAQLKNLHEAEDESLFQHWENSLAFNLSGHILHSLFWFNMSPNPGQPSEALSAAIEKSYGNLDTLKKHFTSVAKTVPANGWAVLVYCPLSDRLMIQQVNQHQNNSIQGAVPLLILDVWEHAFYLDYPADRAAFIQAWWNVADWGAVSRRYELVKK